MMDLRLHVGVRERERERAMLCCIENGGKPSAFLEIEAIYPVTM